IDVDPSQRDLGGYVGEAKQVVQAALADGRLKMPQGYFLKWTGQYEELERMAARMRIIIPATLLLIVVLLFLHFRNLIEVLIVLLSVPFALAGSVWLLWLLDYRFSTAVWVGLIALVGLVVIGAAGYLRERPAARRLVWPAAEPVVQAEIPTVL